VAMMLVKETSLHVTLSIRTAVFATTGPNDMLQAQTSDENTCCRPNLDTLTDAPSPERAKQPDLRPHLPASTTVSSKETLRPSILARHMCKEPSKQPKQPRHPKHPKPKLP
jgi:hypothetical protein